nr:ribonuclease H-like domain-containing protein [Tanacetum cinerariifolium]
MEAEHVQEYCVLLVSSSYTLSVKSLEAKNGDETLIGDTAKTLRKTFAKSTKDLLLQAGADKTSSTNNVNTTSTPVNTASTPVNTASTPVNTASTPVNTASTPVNTASLSRNVSAAGGSYPDLSTYANQDDYQIPSLEDIYEVLNDEIFTSASYDDKGAVADFTNLESTLNVSPIPQSRIQSIHPTTQIFRDPTSTVQTRSKVNKSLGAHTFVDALPEELLQFKTQQVWILVDLPFRKRVIGTKWVYRNKKYERGVIVRNKTRLVAQGHRQEERIDYNEVFAPVARIEAIRIFLAFASYIGVDLPFGKKVIGTKWVYMNKKNERGVIVRNKARSQDKYFTEILKKFDFLSVKTASTPIKTKKPLVKDAKAADVDVHLYRSMIGSLIYLTASRLDIMYAVCACSRFQVTLKTSHLHDVKRIFRRLISWQCKKKTIIAYSTLEAECVAAASYRGQSREACLTDSGFIADQDRATIAKYSTLPYYSAPRVTSPAADEGTQEVEINRLKERVKLLEDRDGVVAQRSGDDAPIKGRNLDEGEAAAERISDDSEDGSIPTASNPAAVEVPTSSDVVPTASLVFATATVVTPYSRRKGKEVMVNKWSSVHHV